MKLSRSVWPFAEDEFVPMPYSDASGSSSPTETMKVRIPVAPEKPIHREVPFPAPKPPPEAAEAASRPDELKGRTKRDIRQRWVSWERCFEDRD